MEATGDGGGCFERRNRTAAVTALEAAERGSTAVASLQKFGLCMTKANCHGKYIICHKKHLMTKRQRHADRHITTVT